jgi:exopolysaccharide biosynthesis WecB/TagA/CpsF family protein
MAMSRLIDIITASVLLVTLSPLIAVRAIIGWVATKRVFSRVERIGAGGRVFNLWRLSGDFPGRSLCTPLNLLTGDLSLAGPRPDTVRQAATSTSDPVRRSVTPGVFSPFEVRRNLGLDWESEASFERDYVHSQQPLSGIATALRTLVGRGLSGSPDRPCPNTISFFGVDIRNTSMDEALDWIIGRARASEPSVLAFVNPDCLNAAYENEDYRAALRSAHRVLPDGIGVHLGCRIKGQRLGSNLNGTDLFPRLCERAASSGASLFLLGARPGIAETAAERMQQRVPGLRIAGTHHGFFKEDETSDVVDTINRSGADILLVAMGAPRQELWLAGHFEALSVPVRMGVGGLFDFYSGRVKRAPVWVREIGMEWVWRILMEPRRMWRRYVVGNPKFLYRVWREARNGETVTDSPVTVSHRTRAIRSASAAMRRIGRRTALAAAVFAKRALDIVGATAGMILLSPFFLLVASAIRLESPGPILFRQERVGRAGIPFRMIKFRSMYIDAEQRREALVAQNEMQGGVLFKMKNDPRITRVGRLIRRASIDELPQLWNVLRGEMSLVGPRPPLPGEVAEYSLSDRRRLLVKPGITCIWQVSGRSDIPFERQVELDLDYIHSQSLKTDIELLLRTVPAVVLGKGAY